MTEKPRTVFESDGWTRERPTEPGIYLRTELWGTPVHAIVEGGGGELFVGLRPVENFDPQLYWLGPLPEVPSDAVVREKKSRVPKTTRKNSPAPLIAGALYDFCEFLAHAGGLSIIDLLGDLRMFAADRDLSLENADTHSWWKTSQTRYQIRRKESGLCIHCSKPAETALFCRKHADAQNERQRLNRALKSQGGT